MDAKLTLTNMSTPNISGRLFGSLAITNHTELAIFALLLSTAIALFTAPVFGALTLIIALAQFGLSAAFLLQKDPTFSVTNSKYMFLFVLLIQFLAPFIQNLQVIPAGTFPSPEILKSAAAPALVSLLPQLALIDAPTA